MKAASLCFVGPRRIEVVPVEVAGPAKGEILVRTTFSGISSGTELLAYRGDIHSSLPLDETLGTLGGTFSFPFRFGYSCAGMVIDGDLPEGTSVFCFHPHQSLFVSRADDAIRLDKHDLRIATMLPLVETALQISIDAGPTAYTHVGVMGLGVVGMLSALLLHRMGANVIASEPAAWRRELARKLGIHAVTPEHFRTEIGAATSGQGLPLVIEASGDPEALRQALPLLAHEGEALVASWYGAKPVTLDLGEAFHRRRLSIRSTQVSTIATSARRLWTVEHRRRVARDLLSRLPLQQLATDVFPLSQADRAFSALDAGNEGTMHVALHYAESDV